MLYIDKTNQYNFLAKEIQMNLIAPLRFSPSKDAPYQKITLLFLVKIDPKFKVYDIVQ